MIDKYTFLGTIVPVNPTDLMDDRIQGYQTSGGIQKFMKKDEKILDVNRVKGIMTSPIKSTNVVTNLMGKITPLLIKENAKLQNTIMGGFKKLAMVKSYNAMKNLEAQNITIDRLDILTENSIEYFTKSLDAMGDLNNNMVRLVDVIDKMSYTTAPQNFMQQTFDTSKYAEILSVNGHQFSPSKYMEFLRSSAMNHQDQYITELAKEIARNMGGHGNTNTFSQFGQMSKLDKLGKLGGMAAKGVEAITPYRFKSMQTANPIVAALLRTIGIDTTIPMAGIKKLAMDIEPTPFDTITKRQIVEVIPSLLSKIHGALTGKQQAEELVFDYPRQQFLERGVLQQEYADLASRKYKKDYSEFGFVDKNNPRAAELNDAVNKRISGMNRESPFIGMKNFERDDEVDSIIRDRIKSMTFWEKLQLNKRGAQRFAEMLDFEDRTENAGYFSSHRVANDQSGGLYHGGLLDPNVVKERYKNKSTEEVEASVKQIYDTLPKNEHHRFSRLFQEPTADAIKMAKGKVDKAHEFMKRFQTDSDGFTPLMDDYQEAEFVPSRRSRLGRGMDAIRTAKESIKTGNFDPRKMGKIKKIRPGRVGADLPEHILDVLYEGFDTVVSSVSKDDIQHVRDLYKQGKDFAEQELLKPFMSTFTDTANRTTKATKERIIDPTTSILELLKLDLADRAKNRKKRIKEQVSELSKMLNDIEFRGSIKKIRESLNEVRESIMSVVGGAANLFKKGADKGKDIYTKQLLKRGFGERLNIGVGDETWTRLFKNDDKRKGIAGTIQNYLIRPMIDGIAESSKNIVKTVKDNILIPVMTTTVDVVNDSLDVIKSNISTIQSFAGNTKKFFTDSMDYWNNINSNKKAFEDKGMGQFIKQTGMMFREVLNGILDPMVKKTVAQLTEIQSHFVKTLQKQFVKLNDAMQAGIREVGAQFRDQFLIPFTTRIMDVQRFTLDSLFGGQRGRDNRRQGVIGDIMDKTAVLVDYYREQVVDGIKKATTYLLEKTREAVTVAFDGFKKGVMWSLGWVYKGINKLIEKDGPLSKMVKGALSPIFSVFNKFINRDKKGGGLFERIADRMGDKIKQLNLEERLRERKEKRIQRMMRVARVDNPIAAAALDAGKDTARHTRDTVDVLNKILRYMDNGIMSQRRVQDVAGKAGFQNKRLGEINNQRKDGMSSFDQAQNVLNTEKNNMMNKGNSIADKLIHQKVIHTSKVGKGNTINDQVNRIKEMDAEQRAQMFQEGLIKNTGDTASGIGVITKGFSKIWMLFPLMLGFLSKVPLLGSAITALTAWLGGKKATESVMDSMDGPDIDGNDKKRRRRRRKRGRGLGGRVDPKLDISDVTKSKGASVMDKLKDGAKAVPWNKVGSGAAKVARVVGKLALPVTALFAAGDAYAGWNEAEEITGKKDPSIVDKTNAAMSSLVSGLTFGLIDTQTIANSDLNVMKHAGAIFEGAKEKATGAVNAVREGASNVMNTARAGFNNVYEGIGRGLEAAKTEMSQWAPVKRIKEVFEAVRKSDVGSWLPPHHLEAVAKIESSGKIDAFNKGSKAAGLFQFIPSTAAWLNLADPFDPLQATIAMARYSKINRDQFVKRMGREPDGRELYLMHQQGAGGAFKLLQNPNQLAADLVGIKAVTGNGGRPNMTGAEFTDLILRKYDSAAGASKNSVEVANPEKYNVPAMLANPNGSGEFTATVSMGGAPSLYDPNNAVTENAVQKASPTSAGVQNLQQAVQNVQTANGQGTGAGPLKVEPGVDVKNLHPGMSAKLQAAAKDFFAATGNKLQVNSGFRSIEEQAALYKQKGPQWAARPGAQMHNYGVAVDIQSSQANYMSQSGILKKNGLTRPIGHEPWHVEDSSINRVALRNAGTEAFSKGAGNDAVSQAWAKTGMKNPAPGVETESNSPPVMLSANTSDVSKPDVSVSNNYQPEQMQTLQRASVVANQVPSQSGMETRLDTMIDVLRSISESTAKAADRDVVAKISPEDVKLLANAGGVVDKQSNSMTNLFNTNNVTPPTAKTKGASSAKENVRNIAKAGV